MPFPHYSWKATHDAILDTGCVVSTELSISDQLTRRRYAPEAKEFAAEFVSYVVAGMKHYAIQLDESQRMILRQQIAASRIHVQTAKTSLRRSRPDLLITNTSATSPTIEFLLTAKSLKIPTLAIQYGLDCDHYAYDDAFADHVAVWSENRKNAYITKSNIQPISIEVTGNPEHIRSIKSANPSEGSWLWVTRPHTPRRCKLASDDPAEGLRILQTLLHAVEQHPSVRLIIKPHPNDYSHLYRQMIERHPCRSRVSLWANSLNAAFEQAELVITEDTTAGMDAMWLRRPLIHVRFTKSPPVLPLIEYRAALPGFSETELLRSLNELAGRKSPASMQDGQQAFLRDFSGAAESHRLTEFVGSVLR